MGRSAIEVLVINWQTLFKLFLGSEFTSTSALTIIKQPDSYTSTRRQILNNRKIEI